MAVKKRPPKDEDPEQSKRFIALAKELEADGGQSPTEAGKAFDRLVQRVIAPRNSSETADD